jgi:hypothetical protein
MKCEEARRRLRLGADAEAEEHVATCATCFEALERQDALVQALRESRPEFMAAPATLAPRVIARWKLRRRLPWAAAIAALLAASIGAAALLWTFASAFSEPLWLAQATFEGLLTPWVGSLLALADILRSRLLDNPALIASLVVVSAAAAAAWVALDREARPPAREPAS